jgi:hypothetical protein
MSPTSTFQIDNHPNRAATNRANSQHSTGPRTSAGKQRSSQNALRHGLTAHTAVLPSEDLTAYQEHCRQFADEYQPATATETHLVQELAGTSWRLRRIPLLEADLLARSAEPPNEEAAIAFDIVDAHRLITSLGLHSARLSRQFEKTLDKLREIQSDRYQRQCRDLKDAAALLEFHTHKGIPWEPSNNGFVFSKGQVERAAQRMTLLHAASTIGDFRFGSTIFPTKALSQTSVAPALNDTR